VIDVTKCQGFPSTMSSENLEIVHEGWLTKSPPAKRVLKAVSVKLVSSIPIFIHNYLNLNFYIVIWTIVSCQNILNIIFFYFEILVNHKNLNRLEAYLKTYFWFSKNCTFFK
jgi:hypothetical protein